MPTEEKGGVFTAKIAVKQFTVKIAFNTDVWDFFIDLIIASEIPAPKWTNIFLFSLHDILNK